MTEGQKQDFITNGRQVARDFIETIQAFNAINSQSAALDAFNQITDADFKGVNEGITRADFFNFISLASGILENLPVGSNTTLYKVSF